MASRQPWCQVVLARSPAKGAGSQPQGNPTYMCHIEHEKPSPFEEAYANIHVHVCEHELTECGFFARVVAPEVFLRPLTDKFSRLAMQLLARYTSWLKQGTSTAEGAPEPTSEGQVRHDQRTLQLIKGGFLTCNIVAHFTHVAMCGCCQASP